MAKLKHQKWDFENPDDSMGAFYLANYGLQHKGAHRVARVLTLNSKDHCSNVRSDQRLQDHAGELVRKGEIKTVSEFFEAIEKRWAGELAGVVRELCYAAYAGNGDSFRRLADSIDFIRTHEQQGSWADPLAQRIWAYVFDKWVESIVAGPLVAHEDFMKSVGYFNIEGFMDWSGLEHDRKTVTKRVRRMGYRVKTGRPKETTKRPKR